MALSALTMKHSGSHEYTFSNTSRNATFVMQGSFTDRISLKDDLLDIRYSDLSQVVNSGITSDETVDLDCVNVRIDPVGVGSSGTPEYCLFTADFYRAGLDISYSDIDDWDISGNYAGENVLLDNLNWKWEDTSKPITAEEGINGVKILPQINLVYTGRWPTINLSKIYGCLGKVNNDTFIGAAAEKVLLSGVSFDKIRDEGETYFAISYNFGHNDETWNNFYRQSDATFAGVVTVGSDKVVFEKTDFTQLEPKNW